MTRNETIADLYYNETKSYAEIGRMFNLTRERVRQIVNRYDHPNRATIIANTARRKYWTSDAGIAVLKSLRDNGLSYQEIADQTDAGTKQWVHVLLSGRQATQDTNHKTRVA